MAIGLLTGTQLEQLAQELNGGNFSLADSLRQHSTEWRAFDQLAPAQPATQQAFVMNNGNATAAANPTFQPIAQQIQSEQAASRLPGYDVDPARAARHTQINGHHTTLNGHQAATEAARDNMAVHLQNLRHNVTGAVAAGHMTDAQGLAALERINSQVPELTARQTNFMGQVDAHRAQIEQLTQARSTAQPFNANPNMPASFAGVGGAQRTGGRIGALPYENSRLLGNKFLGQTAASINANVRQASVPMKVLRVGGATVGGVYFLKKGADFIGHAVSGKKRDGEGNEVPAGFSTLAMDAVKMAGAAALVYATVIHGGKAKAIGPGI